MIRSLVTMWVALALAVGLGAQSSTPRDVKLLLVIADIAAVHDLEQAVEIDLVVRVTWTDPRLAHDGSDHVSRSLDDVWHPRGQVVRGSALRELRPRTVEIEPDGTVVYRQRYVGKLRQHFDFTDFPLDRQTIRVDVVSSFFEDELRIVVDERSGRFEDLSVPDWTIGPASVSVEPQEFLGDSYPSVRVTLPAQRRIAFYIWKVLIPLAMIMFMSWCVFWINPQNAGPQIGMATTSMLTLIAYRFALGQTLPNVPYLTRMDSFITGSSALVFLALIEVITTTTLAENGRLATAKRVDLICRMAFPILFVGIVVWSFWG